MPGTFLPTDAAAAFRRLGQRCFFVQIGAMDGITFDPINPYIKQMHWRGILVEPIPDMFEKLRHAYSGCPNLIFVNKAIADYNGRIEMTRIDALAVARNLIGIGALGVSTIMPHRGVLGGAVRLKQQTQKIINAYKRTLTVPCLRLPTLLRKYNVQKIDLLMIDTEGADWMIARQLPLEKYRPRLVYLEYDHLQNCERTACIRHLQKAGYRVRLDQRRQELLAELYR
jgi:FkbM family methyltransferase